MATKANLVVDQGSTYSTKITLTDDDGNPLDLTGYSGAGQIRKHYTSSSYTAFAVTITPSTGEIALSLTATQTSNLSPGRYMYDVEITTGATVSRVLEGIVTVTPECTR